MNLEPFVTYEYRVAAWNSYGRGFSEISRAVTKQDVPQGVNPPKWAKVDNREDMILLNWEEPLQPNGIDAFCFLSVLSIIPVTVFQNHKRYLN